ncbi:MAG: hypothetical protein AAGC60_13025 [Acidobacteriota bacterium]
MAVDSLERLPAHPLDAEGEASAKRRVERVVRELPDDSSFDDILRELAFHRMMARGLADAEDGLTISHVEVVRRSRTWIR